MAPLWVNQLDESMPSEQINSKATLPLSGLIFKKALFRLTNKKKELF